MKKLFAKFRAWARGAELAMLQRELDGLDATRRYCDEREPVLRRQIEWQQRELLMLDLPTAGRAGDRWTGAGSRKTHAGRPWSKL